MKTDILTFTGNYFDFTDISSNTVTIFDIAQGLSNVCRFAGQCPKFYSVAQHSVLVAKLINHSREATDLSKEERRIVVFQGLMHDATEAFLGDVTTPLKKLLAAYKALETELHADLMRRLGLPIELHALVKHYDLVALAIEQREVMKNTDEWLVLKDIRPPRDYALPVQTPEQARESFLNYYLNMTAELTCS